jgi:hypothetical protein
MDFSFLTSPEFWAATFLAYLIPKISPYIDSRLRDAWILISNEIPLVLRTHFRNGKAKRLRDIKSKRWSFASINYEIAKLNSLFLLFCGVIGVYLFLLINGSLISVIKANFWLGVSLTLPIYFFELVWLAQDHKTRKLIELNSRIRVTSRPNGRR